MENGTNITMFQRLTATIGAVIICLVIILAMFSDPSHGSRLSLISPPVPVLSAGTGNVFHVTPEAVLSLFVIGLVSGTFGGMLGMGGGVLKMSFLLLFFGFHPGVSRFAALTAYFVVALGASYRYMKLNYIMMDVVRVLIPSGIAGIILGAFIGHYLSRDIMTILLGIFLMFIAVVMVRRIVSRYIDFPTASAGVDTELEIPVWKIFLCGYPGGFVSAMLGISGGVVTNPLQQVFAQIPIKNAIANTLAKACFTVPIACIIILILGVRAGQFDFWTPLLVAFCLIPGSLIGSQLGPALTRRMSTDVAHVLFCTIALFMGINMLFFSN